MPAMDQIPAVPSEVQVTRPTLTVPRRSHMYNYSPEERPGLRERLQQRAQACGRCSRGRVWEVVKRRLPILDWLPKYNPRQALLGDITAGVTVGVMSIPQGMGYALMADLPPITGLYASIFSSLVYMLLGTSHHVSLGLVASLCMLTGKVVGDLATLEAPPTANGTDFSSTFTATQSTEEAYITADFTDYADFNTTAAPTYTPTQVAMTLTIVTGVWQVLMGAFQLGEVFTVLLSEMVISGFTTGVAFHVLTSQAKNLLGIPVPRYSGPFKAFYTYRDLFKNLLHANPAVLVVSATCLVVLVVNNEVIKPKVRKVSRLPLPIELVVVCLGTLTSYLLDMTDNHNVAVIGHVPKGFPAPSMPLQELIPHMFLDSVLIGVIGYTLAISMTKILAKKQGYTIEPTQELYAQGFINVVGSFFSCAPMSVSLSRSLVQEAAGGVTNITSLFTSGFLIAVLYSIGPLFESLPICVLSSIILVALKGLFLQVHDLSRLWSSSRPDAAIWLVSCVVSIVVDLDYGLLAGVVTSLLVLLLRGQRPPTASLGHVPSTDLYLDLDRYHKAVEVPGVKIFQFGGPLHFGNAPYFRSSLFSATGLDLDALKAANASPKTKEQPTDAPLPTVEKEVFVVVVGPEFNTSPPSQGDAPKDYDSQDDVSIYDSNEDVSERDTSRDDSSHSDVSQHDTNRDDAVQNDKNKADAHQNNHDAASRNDVIQNDASKDDSDDDDDTSDSGVSQATTQDAVSASPSTPRLTERTVGTMNDDEPSTSSSTPTLTWRTVADEVCTLPSTIKLTDTQGTLAAMHSGAAKESTCIRLPVPRWLVLDLTLVSFVDSTGAAVLKQLHRDLQPAGVTLCLASASDRVLQALDKCGVLQEVSSDLTFHSTHDAVTAITCAGTRQAKDDLQKP